MKLYCELCSKTQPVRIDNCRDAKTNEPFQDIVCAECDLVIASGTDIAQPEQEPVAWIEKDVLPLTHIIKAVVRREKDEQYVVPLYIAPQKREWVGLAKDEIREMIMGMRTKNMGVIMTEEIFRDVEAKLKEKNT